MSKVSVIGEFVRLLKRRKRLWLLPIIIVLLVLGLLIVLTEGSVIAPLIYTLF